MTRRRAACCCEVTPPTLSCPQINLLCHGPGPATISISGESTYSATASYLVGTETGDVWTAYQIYSGVCQFELTGPYIAEGVNNTGINYLTGTLTATISQYDVPSDTMIVVSYAVQVSTVDFYPSANYACGHFEATLGGLYNETWNGLPRSNGPTNWAIYGLICNPCLNPTIVCAPRMQEAYDGGVPLGPGFITLYDMRPMEFNFYGTRSETIQSDVSFKLDLTTSGYLDFSVT